MGRFLTRDTWQGKANDPLSLNLWNYVQSNPINYVDPSGHERASCDREPSSSNNIAYIENNVHLAKSDWINTYAAAGIAVQCWRDTWAWDQLKSEGDYSAFGPAQITNKWTSTPYGDWIENPKYPGDHDYDRGYGLRCYVPLIYLRFPKEVQIELAKSCSLCFLKGERSGITNFDQFLALEPMYDQRSIDGATIYMKRLIQLAVNACRSRPGGCTSTDIYIAAALAQNGPGLNYVDLGSIGKSSAEVYKNDDIRLDWYGRFAADIKNITYGIRGINTKEQLNRFTRAIKALRIKGWSVPDSQPDFNWDTIELLQNWTINQELP